MRSEFSNRYHRRLISVRRVHYADTPKVNDRYASDVYVEDIVFFSFLLNFNPI